MYVVCRAGEQLTDEADPCLFAGVRRVVRARCVGCVLGVLGVGLLKLLLSRVAEIYKAVNCVEMATRYVGITCSILENVETAAVIRHKCRILSNLCGNLVSLDFLCFSRFLFAEKATTFSGNMFCVRRGRRIFGGVCFPFAEG